MYNLSIEVEYDDLDSYQTALLSVFGLSEYSDEIIVQIEAIYSKVQDVAQFVNAVNRIRVSGIEDSYFLLFNYDNFKATHNAIVQWHKTGNCVLNVA